MEMEENAIQKLQAQLKALRPVLLTRHGHSFLDLFDEFMQQREFGLALHAVCDFILEPDSPRVNRSTLDQIQQLHVAMDIDDGCIQELRRKS